VRQEHSPKLWAKWQMESRLADLRATALWER
jgi:hypothetical protein